ncbi:MAG: Flp pilus assembly complex ATPase component TadA [Deltaproteobacteria bacterium]|nr:Flp pilus assembly complex ATPase component TadA [Deltaproteobacteria bacterium]
MEKKPGKRLGEKLLKRGLITPEQLRIGLEIQKSTGVLLGEILVDSGFLSQKELGSVLSEDVGVTHLSSLADVIPDPAALKMVPKEIAQRHRVAPLLIEDNELTVAVVDPFDVVTVDTLRRLTGKMIKTLVAPETEILKIIDIWYVEGVDLFEDIVKKAVSSVGALGEGIISEEAPLVKLVNYLIVNGVKERATDIHIEPEKNTVVVRYRIDGVLYVRQLLPKALERSVISRIKVMADLDISESRLPQDGRADFRFGGRVLDLRLSFYPTSYGENAVLRILDREKLVTRIDGLGFSERQMKLFRKLIKGNQGIILVTGPTGCGKTTTLYAALSEINSTQINIMTVEDPIEYELLFVRQSQVNPRIGLTFAKGLRSILRQDPDVVLVGEIRDEETMEVAMHAALTGHLVLTTLHTNSAVGAISRLLYLGASPYVLASAVIGVLAQRLVRVICPDCKKSYSPTDEERELVEGALNGKIKLPAQWPLYRGEGCKRCNQTGYIGRTAVSEIFEVDKEIFNLIARGATDEEMEQALEKQRYITMFQDGLIKALQGVTSVEEVLRVA